MANIYHESEIRRYTSEEYKTLGIRFMVGNINKQQYEDQKNTMENLEAMNVIGGFIKEPEGYYYTNGKIRVSVDGLRFKGIFDPYFNRNEYL
jgi:hypothetical protein